MAGVGLAPRPAMAAEDIRNLQLWKCQERRALGGRLGLGLLLLPVDTPDQPFIDYGLSSTTA
jgi:hypothetical protein